MHVLWTLESVTESQKNTPHPTESTVCIFIIYPYIIIIIIHIGITYTHKEDQYMQSPSGGLIVA